ncbi:hypothetical protein TNCV_5109311 [Trichonephila clavipes]|nr:hypothetical protein TNCV_5109311 [Trichonephila clavipes]
MLPVLGKKAVLEWCMEEGLIGSSYVCPKCGKSMELKERTEGRRGLAIRACVGHLPVCEETQGRGRLADNAPMGFNELRFKDRLIWTHQLENGGLGIGLPLMF